MSVEQQWIFGGLISTLLLLLFPPFFYGKIATNRQWHFFLESRRTSYTTNHCPQLASNANDVFPAYIHNMRVKDCLKEKKLERGMPGRIDVLFLALEMAVIGVGLCTGYYLHTVVRHRALTQGNDLGL